jgi:hypothetical protein
MKSTHQYRLTLPPREELTHLVSLVSGMLASNQCTPGPDRHPINGVAELPVARDIAGQLLEQLRLVVERRVEEFPERYDLASQPPTE